MAALRKVLAAILALIALAVAVQATLGEVYNLLPAAPLAPWNVSNWFMAGAVLVALAYAYRNKRRVDKAGGGLNFAYLGANGLLLAAIALTLWFFRHWFGGLVGDEPGEAGFFVWSLVKALFVVIVGATAWRLWTGGSAAAPSPSPPHPEGEGQGEGVLPPHHGRGLP